MVEKGQWLSFLLYPSWVNSDPGWLVQKQIAPNFILMKNLKIVQLYSYMLATPWQKVKGLTKAVNIAG